MSLNENDGNPFKVPAQLSEEVAFVKKAVDFYNVAQQILSCAYEKGGKSNEQPEQASLEATQAQENLDNQGRATDSGGQDGGRPPAEYNQNASTERPSSSLGEG